MSETEDRYVAALLRERDDCSRSGRADRVAAIDTELARNGHKPPTPQPVADAPAARSRGQRTAKG